MINFTAKWVKKACQYTDRLISYADRSFTRRFNAHGNRIELIDFLSRQVLAISVLWLRCRCTTGIHSL